MSILPIRNRSSWLAKLIHKVGLNSVYANSLYAGRRTIGVLTKLDLMDAGTNALDILTGRVYPLKLGFIGVINRSQQDIIGNKPMSDALKDEAQFFKSHVAYRTIAHRCGTQYLSKTLNSVSIQVPLIAQS